MMKSIGSKPVKMRKVGGSTVLTVPKGIAVTEQEYDVYQGRGGQIIYSPKRANPFLDPNFVKTHDFTQTEVIGGQLSGHEIPID